LKEIKNYAVKMSFSSIRLMPHFVKIGPLVQKMERGTDTQIVWWSHKPTFFPLSLLRKESRLESGT